LHKAASRPHRAAATGFGRREAGDYECAESALDSAKRFLPTLKSVGKGTMGDLRRGIDELERAIQEYDDGQ
jgi:hypothetical protein